VTADSVTADAVRTTRDVRPGRGIAVIHGLGHTFYNPGRER
jgi:hypothetical protein